MKKIIELVSVLKKCSDIHKDVTLGLEVIGGAYLINKAWNHLKIAYKYFLIPKNDLKAKYGNGWAIITGASDGLGKAYAYELANRGFNVGLISRNKEKLQNIAQDIHKLYGVYTKVVVFDFDQAYTEDKIDVFRKKL